MHSQELIQATILVVIDDYSAGERICTILQEEAYAVRHASGSRGLLDRIRQDRPDLILLDVTKPDSEAPDICRRLNGDPVLQSIPVILMISDPNRHALEVASGSGAVDFIIKPVNRLELLARINLLLKMKPMMEKRAEAEKLKGVLETAGGVCHSLNQPLQYVLGAVQILLMDLTPDDKMFRSLDTIREKVEQMGVITRKLAEVTRCRTIP